MNESLCPKPPCTAYPNCGCALSPPPTAGREEDHDRELYRRRSSYLAPSPSAEPVAWQQGIDLLREVQGYAQANTDAARTQDEQDTWRAHWRNVTRAVDLLSMVAAQSPASPASPVSDARGREALETALQEIVLTIAFLNRDVGSYRMKSTVEDLSARLARADAKIRAALSPSFDNSGGGK